MCGRFTLSVSPELLAEYFELLGEPDLAALTGRAHPRWNIAPTEAIGVVLPAGDSARRQMTAMQWGLGYSFSKGRPLFNARSERLHERFWRRSFRERRCLVPVTSFYEWQDVGTKRRLPHEIRLRDRPVAAFAGIWDENVDRTTGEVTRWCSVITTDACPLLREIHNAGANRFRQPAFVDREDFAAWLQEGEPDPSVLSRIFGVRDSNEFEALPLARIGDDERRTAPVAQEGSVEAPRTDPGGQLNLL